MAFVKYWQRKASKHPRVGEDSGGDGDKAARTLTEVVVTEPQSQGGVVGDTSAGWRRLWLEGVVPGSQEAGAAAGASRRGTLLLKLGLGLGERRGMLKGLDGT